MLAEDSGQTSCADTHLQEKTRHARIKPNMAIDHIQAQKAGHCRLLSHLYRLKISHTDQCPCDTGPQTPEHVLQACPTFDTLRRQHRGRQTWPSEVELREKLWGTAASLRPTAGFALNTGLDI
ncbi:hypothetical protein V1264_011526 [Littorina saxatilis]|uniref:Uncharacterized protein n=1 Tax=Littorina saxatilis TaxID=31220 RepID=A0AAN9BV75_9CAEN